MKRLSAQWRWLEAGFIVSLRKQIGKQSDALSLEHEGASSTNELSCSWMVFNGAAVTGGNVSVHFWLINWMHSAQRNMVCGCTRHCRGKMNIYGGFFFSTYVLYRFEWKPEWLHICKHLYSLSAWVMSGVEPSQPLRLPRTYKKHEWAQISSYW